MEDYIEALTRQHSGDRRAIPDVESMQCGAVRQCIRMASGEVVDHDDPMPPLQKV
jgi:hypothetical protein